jgi:excisionase family DNA binding protein
MQLWSVQDVSSQLGVSVPTIYNYVRDRQIPYLRVGGRIRFRPDDIAQWLDDQLSPVRT